MKATLRPESHKMRALTKANFILKARLTLMMVILNSNSQRERPSVDSSSIR
jgi:hypothetical protein